MFWFFLAGCPRPVPDHLRLTPAPTTAGPTAVVITDEASALQAIVGRDPLVRAPQLPDPTLLESVEGGEPLAAFVRQVRAIEAGNGPPERMLQQLEDEHRTTAVVALARGYRLRLAENHLSNPLVGQEESDRSIATLVTPLGLGASDPTLPKRPLEWLAPNDDREAVRAYAERWVLTGWLASPRIPLGVLSEPLAGPQYDALRSSSLGRLIVARANQQSANTDAGMADLRQATRLALERTAADRDSEQASWANTKRLAAESLATTDPIVALLERAESGLISGAMSDRAAGGALLAIAALRWENHCPNPPCTGVDRVEAMQFAARWDPEIASLAALWQVIALKMALDSLEVGRETGLFPKMMTDLTDALLGSGAGPLDIQLLRKQRPDPSVWLTVGRSVGSEGLTDWEGARAALGKHLANEVERARSLVVESSPEEAVLTFLDRIRARAVP